VSFSSFNDRSSLLVAQSNWREVQRALEAGAIAVLPVGAAAKAHGLHLPMNTDCVQAEWLAARISQTKFAAVWPTLSYGHYPAFVDYPGSCSLTRETFQAMATQVIDHILRAGGRAVLIVNTGISTIEPLRSAIDKSSHPARVRLANVYEGAHYRAAEARVKEQVCGSHADELETSIMLAIAPDSVRMDLAEACTCKIAPGPLNRSDPAAANYSPSGVYGDPRPASKDKGEVLLRAILTDLTALIADMRGIAQL
jgi:creatinine amidohydrolase